MNNKPISIREGQGLRNKLVIKAIGTEAGLSPDEVESYLKVFYTEIKEHYFKHNPDKKDADYEEFLSLSLKNYGFTRHKKEVNIYKWLAEQEKSKALPLEVTFLICLDPKLQKRLKLKRPITKLQYQLAEVVYFHSQITGGGMVKSRLVLKQLKFFFKSLRKTLGKKLSTRTLFVDIPHYVSKFQTNRSSRLEFLIFDYLTCVDRALIVFNSNSKSEMGDIIRQSVEVSLMKIAVYLEEELEFCSFGFNFYPKITKKTDFIG